MNNDVFANKIHIFNCHKEVNIPRTISMFRSNRKIKEKHTTLVNLLNFPESANQLW